MSQKTNSMLKLALVFFISLLSFSIGTYVGKKYSDNQYKLSQLEPGKKEGHAEGSEFATRNEGDEHAPAETHEAKHEGDSQNLTDSEVAKIAEEFASEPTESAHEGNPIQTTEADEKEIKTINAEKPAAHTAAATTTHATPVVAKPMPAKTVVAATTHATVPAEREPSSIKPSNGAQFTVQIGSFPSELDAKKMTNELLAKGIKTSYVPAQVKGQTYFRVNVGLFGTAKEADEYKKDFLEKTKMTSAFVQKVQ